MAVMGRKKRMVKNIIEASRAKTKELEREVHNNKSKKEEISKEEHEKRLSILREMGLLKEDSNL